LAEARDLDQLIDAGEGDVVRQSIRNCLKHVVKLRGVEDVKELSPKLQVVTLCKTNVFGKGDISENAKKLLHAARSATLTRT